MPNQAIITSSLSASSQSFRTSRSHSRPPPISLRSCLSPSDLEGRYVCSPSSVVDDRHINPSRAQAPVEPITSPAFLKGDLNFTTFRERAARAIAEWGPSPTGACFPASNATPRRNRTGLTLSNSPASHGLQVPDAAYHSAVQSSFISPPLTPLTPAPHTRPQHREHNSSIRRSSLKLSKRPRPSPLQLKAPISNDASQNDCHCEIEYIRNVRFADGSPMRGSTWHITQYPARLASPPISAANLSLADLTELQAIKQSLGTWCGEMMGSPMRGSFSQSYMSSVSDYEASKGATLTRGPFLSSLSYTASPVSCSQEDEDNPWGHAEWPDDQSCGSDCDSEIFEGMH